MKLRGALPLVLVALVLVPSVLQPTVELARSLEGDGGARYAAILSRLVHSGALWRASALAPDRARGRARRRSARLPHARDRAPRRLARRLALAPLFLSPVLGTLSFHFLFGQGGVLRHFFPGSSGEFRGFDAVLVVHVLTMFVYFFMFTSAALQRLDWELVLAARSLGGDLPPRLPHRRPSPARARAVRRRRR